MKYKAEIAYIKNDFSVRELNNEAWEKAETISVEKYWSGEIAPVGRRFKTKLVWSDAALYACFEAHQNEPLIVSETPDLSSKTRGLWDRDVCEIFLAPDKSEPRKYFEFEIAPTGEWIDLGIFQKTDERITDWDYASGMESFAKIEKEKIRMAMRIEWKAFGSVPAAGDVWLGNIFRCVGAGAARGYLAWSPTFTPTPAFHITEKFGEFEFVK